MACLILVLVLSFIVCVGIHIYRTEKNDPTYKDDYGSYR